MAVALMGFLPFNVLSRTRIRLKREPKLPPIRERFAPGCFGFHLRHGGEVELFVEHDRDRPAAARRSDCSLRVREERDGVIFEASNLPPWAAPFLDHVRYGLLRELSIGFVLRQYQIDEIAGERVRTIVDADLWELSPVREAAYSGTWLALVE